jgi:hypothetical protein
VQGAGWSQPLEHGALDTLTYPLARCQDRSHLARGNGTGPHNADAGLARWGRSATLMGHRCAWRYAQGRDLAEAAGHAAVVEVVDHTMSDADAAKRMREGMAAQEQERMRRQLGPLGAALTLREANSRRLAAAELAGDGYVMMAPTTVSRPFPSWNRSILTEIYLCHACSYQ